MVLPCIDEHHMIDLRTMSYDVPSQEMLTKDSVTVSVDAAVYYRARYLISSAHGYQGGLSLPIPPQSQK